MQRRTKALSISREVKQAVFERDGGRCVVCGRPGLPEAHVVPRSQGGLGVEGNIVTLCRDCHRRYDQSGERRFFAREIRAYLKRIDPQWDETQLTYRKGETDV